MCVLSDTEVSRSSSKSKWCNFFSPSSFPYQSPEYFIAGHPTELKSSLTVIKKVTEHWYCFCCINYPVGFLWTIIVCGVQLSLHYQRWSSWQQTIDTSIHTELFCFAYLCWKCMVPLCMWKDVSSCVNAHQSN